MNAVDLRFACIFCACLAGCSGEPAEVQLAPPPQWQSGLAGALSSARERTDQLSEAVARSARASVDRNAPHLTSPALAAAIRFSRQQARGVGPREVPAEVRLVLEPYFDPALIERVRWTLAGRRISLGSLLAGWYYDEGAVTLEDVIVFSDPKVAENVWLWAHELTHVEQYARFGADGFALRYVLDWRSLEAEATANAFRITADIRRRRSTGPDAGSAAWPQRRSGI